MVAPIFTEKNIKEIHDALVEMHFSNTSLPTYCKNKGITQSSINNFLMRLRSAVCPRPHQAHHIEHFKKYQSSDINLKGYAKLNELNYESLKIVKYGNDYKEILENMEGIHPEFFDIIQRKRVLRRPNTTSIESRACSETVIKYYELLKEYEGFYSNLSRFAKIKKVDYANITSYKAIFSFHLTNKERFEEYLKHIEKAKEEGLTFQECARRNNLSIATMNTCLRNVRYRKIIEAYEKKEKKEMNFIPVNQEEEKKEEKESDARVIVKDKVISANSLELSVSNDIKVSVSKDVPTEKLIKIIDFLRGL